MARFSKVSCPHSVQSQRADCGVVDVETKSASEVARFPEFCFWTAHMIVNENSDRPVSLYIGLSHGGKLHVASDEAARTLAANANSFTVTPGFLIFTTTAHVAQFAPLNTLASLLTTPEATLPEFETRRVERGSRIVTAVPSTMSLVLQMPRGNLETINPRPLVMEIVRQDIDRYVASRTRARKDLG